MHDHRPLSRSRLLTLLLTLTATATAVAAFARTRELPRVLANAAAGQPAAKLELKPGDHICIIGNTLAERMQHDGWLETALHLRFPKHKLVFRNLGFSGDELKLRLRSMDFGTPDQWLAGSAPVPQPRKLVTRHGVRDNRFATTNTRADVVFAFFGYNESFAGKAGLAAFKKDLADFIKHTLAQKYNGKSAPRLVLFSPIAHEDLKDRNFPAGLDNNARLEMYTKAMAEVAAANRVPFVDLFHPTRKLYEQQLDWLQVGGKPLIRTPSDRRFLELGGLPLFKTLTINGVHLNEYGNRLVAEVIDRALFAGQAKPKRDPAKLERLRQAVLDKNLYWFSRYRVLDGYNVYGGRAFEKYADQQSNYEDQQRELEIFDVKTSNRDKRIWAIAQGGDLKIDDSNCPPLIPVKTNKPGRGPNGQHLFLSGEEAIKKMTVAKGLEVTLFASEEKFPELAKPVQMQFDSKGRLWVAAWPSYPHWNPTEERNDKLLVFEDTDGDGKADKVTVFADHLHCPTGFEFYNGGVIVAQAPDLIFLKDTKGTGKADLRVRVLHGLDSADSHHTANSFVLDPGGALYFQEGVFHHTQVETPYGPPVRCVNAGVYRYEPRSQKFDAYVSFGFANPHGHVFDRWGQDIVVDGTGANPYHAALFSGHLDYPQKHGRPPQVYQQRTRPCPGMEYLSSKHFPEEFQGNLLVANVIGFQGILRYQIEPKGASLGGTELAPILSSSDPNFRPSDLKVGPDGAIWFIDWQNPIIGHLQHALRDPSRDRTHGRIYRVTYKGRPLSKPAKIAGEPIDKLLDLLKSPEDRVRYRARIELGSRDSNKVVAALTKWVAGLDKSDAAYEHHLLEALWAHQYQNVVNVDLLKRVLGLKDFRARAAATRVLCYWRDRIPEALDLLLKMAADPAPRVRLEAVRAASFFREAEAIEVVLVADQRPADPFITFVRGETLRVLDPLLQKAIAAKRPLRFKTPAGARYVLKSISTDDLLKTKRDQNVYLELLFRKGVRDEYRREALAGLAKLENKKELSVLLASIQQQDDQPGSREESVVYDLVRLLTGRRAAELKEARAELEKMATRAKSPVTRELGFVALIAADGGVDKAWSLALKSTRALRDLVDAMPLLRDPGQRASLYPKVASLLGGLPKELGPVKGGKRSFGRYVRIELPGKRKTLTLAEVEVYSDGRNVARGGKARQKNTAYGGDAGRAIDGNKSGGYGGGGQTHTLENTANPWWEVDLGREYPIDAIVVYNRTDDGLGNRLNGFTLKVLDGDHTLIMQKQKLPAPKESARYEISSESPERVIRWAAMNALASVRGQEAETFKVLVPFAKKEDRHAAIKALQRIPVRYWPKEEAKPLLDSLLAYVRKVPVKERTEPAALDALQLADSLASLLPLAEARMVRKELAELGVRVVRVGTVVEQMIYDKERLVVQAGKPVEIFFENTDLMPHNFALLQPGALVEIGEQAEADATKPGALERGYVPVSKKILLASRLLQPRESQKLSLIAPTKPGVYPYVCTYPGHWRRMYGALYVVEDLDEYQADPEGYLAKHPLPIADELLKNNRPRKEWKLDDLAAAVNKLEGRSFINGRQLFQVATCVACHKFNGVGTELGPDLTKLDPKQQSALEILKDVLDPSFRINEKYQSWTIETTKGKVVTGLIVKETPQEVEVLENPLAKTPPRVIKKKDIAEKKKSPISIMPKGLLDKLTREEILDLVAYVASKGDPKHKLFQGGHHHH